MIIRLIIIVCIFTGLSSCILSMPPHMGGPGYGTYTYDIPGSKFENSDVVKKGRKTGTACVIGDSIIPFFYIKWRGDSSIRAAAANGGIEQISTIAYRYSKPLFGSVQMCTVVYGQ